MIAAISIGAGILVIAAIAFIYAIGSGNRYYYGGRMHP